MPAINANIIVDTTTLTLTPSSTSIGVTVDPVTLSVFTSAPSSNPPGGTIGQLQYNNGTNTFSGLANSNVSGGTLTFENLSNLKIAGGATNYSLITDGAGNLSWSDTTTSANYANFSNVAFNLNATSTSNVIIGGGTNGYFLQTDGTGALTWNAGTTTPGTGVPGGANTQIQYNDAGNFGGQAGFTFDEVTGDVNMPADLTISGIFTGDGGGLANISSTIIANGTSNVDIATVDGNVNTSVGGIANMLVVTSTGANILGYANVVGNVDTAGIFNGDGGGISNIQPGNIVGLSLSEIANGTSNVSIATVDGNIDLAVGGSDVARFSTTGAAYPAVLTVQGNINAFNDITAEPGANFVGSATLVDLTVSDVTNANGIIMNYGIEDVNVTSVVSSGTENINILTDSATNYKTVDQPGNVIVNFRGNASTTFDSIVGNSKSLTTSYVIKNGSTAYSVTGIEIDSSTQTISWVNDVVPVPAVNSQTSYTFTIIKTATTPTYDVLGSATRYG